MKKSILFSLLCGAFLLSCSNDEPKQTKQVTFTVDAFHVSTQPMHAPSKAPILDDNDGQALTDLYIFDGTTQLAHQTSDMESFGTVTLSIEYGSHNLSFIATRSLGLSYADGVLSCTSLRPTFGKLQAVTVSDATDAFDIEMNRVTGQLVITIEDAIPNDADHLTFTVSKKYDQLNVTTLNGSWMYAFEQTVSLTSAVGQTGKHWTLNMLCPTYTTQYTTDVTLAVYRSDDSLIAQHTIADVPVCSNTKTLLHGELFRGQSFTISANHTWEDALEPSW